MISMSDNDRGTLMRMAAFEQIRRLGEAHDHLTANELKPGFIFEGERIPFVNPQRGIFKPQQMRFLLSIKTVFPKPGGKIWCDDQREAHRQIFEGDETVDYAFMGQNPEAADNRWLREALENRIPVIYFLGIAPGRYQAMFPAFISGIIYESDQSHLTSAAAVTIFPLMNGGDHGTQGTWKTLSHRPFSGRGYANVPRRCHRRTVVYRAALA